MRRSLIFIAIAQLVIFVISERGGMGWGAVELQVEWGRFRVSRRIHYCSGGDVMLVVDG